MIIHEINDPELIRKVLCHPEIYPAISDDNSPRSEDFWPIFKGLQYIAGFKNGEIAGIMVYHQFNDIPGAVKCHLNVLPEYRGELAYQFARMAFCFGMAKNADIYAEIPRYFSNVIWFAKSLEFKEIGEIINGCKIGGISHDLAVLRREKNGCCS